MWKQDQAVGKVQGGALAEAANTPIDDSGAEGRRSTGKDVGNIGRSVVIKGQLNGSEDLIIEGHVEGTIELRDHVLTIGPNGRVKAQVFAKSVIVLGELTGNVTASNKVDIQHYGSVDGDIVAPRVSIAESAHFRGSVDMHRAARLSELPHWRMPVEVVVPQRDAKADENTVTLKQAVAELLETFEYLPDPQGDPDSDARAARGR